MSGDRGFSFPITAISVAALLVSGAYLAPQLLDPLRLTEADAVKVQMSDPPVEARLWEDPFAAVDRHRTKLKKECTAAKQPGSPESGCQDVGKGPAKLPTEFQTDSANLTVIAALLPGAGFVGVEEQRRRVRYALLAGLSAQGFAPDSGEHMRLLSVSVCESFIGCPPDADAGQKSAGVTTTAAGTQVAMNAAGASGGTTSDASSRMSNPSVPERQEAPPSSGTEPKECKAAGCHAFDIGYETLHAGMGKDRRRAVVLWIDDTKIGKRWLSTLAVLLREVRQGAPSEKTRLTVVGPYDSDKLVDTLGVDLATIREEAVGSKAEFIKNWETLRRLQLISPFSTASTEKLLAEARERSPAAPGQSDYCSADSKTDCIVEGFEVGLKAIAKELRTPESDVAKDFFVRTIGRDSRQIDLLVDELLARGLAGGGDRRVILLREWDSIYARTYAESLRTRLYEKSCVVLEVYSYLRGLDGATVDGAPKLQRLVARSGDKEGGDRKPKPQIEWPESRDQRDYVRRLVASIESGAGRTPNMTLSKCAGAQHCMRNQGADGEGRGKGRVVAVGMIGADVHDKLILAQALRASFPDRMLFTADLDARFMHPEVLKSTRNLVVASSLDLVPDVLPAIGIAPFRDSYQTAVYRAAHYAASSREAVPPEPKSRLFEIGNDGVINLGVEPDDTTRETTKRLYYAGAALIGLALLGWLMLFATPAPAMKTALAGGSEPDVDRAPDGFATFFIAGLQAAAWGFALAVVIELAWAGSVGPHRALAIAAAFALSFLAVVYLGVRNARSGDRFLSVFATIAVLAMIGALFDSTLSLLPDPDQGSFREPLAPGTGTSAWPSQLLRTLGVVLFAWFLDFAWNSSAGAARHIGREYFASEPQPPPFRFWQLNSGPEKHVIGGVGLWRSYLGLLGNRSRLARLLVWAAAVAVVLLMEWTLLGGEKPEIPARGVDDRALFQITVMALVFGTIILLVIVADVTLQTWRIVGVLKDGRTAYPEKTISSYWARLGMAVPKAGLKNAGDAPPDAARAQRAHASVQDPIQARVEDRREGSGVVPRNSLLDEWIDARLLAEHTEKIGPLIVFPFVLIALLIVSRSRLLDNWAPGGVVMVALATYLLWAVAVAAMVNVIAEIARRDAVNNMRADLLWMEGRGKPYDGLAGRFKGVIDEVVNLRQGAFAPFFEQPLVRAILVAVGGAGGVQLLEVILFGW